MLNARDLAQSNENLYETLTVKKYILTFTFGHQLILHAEGVADDLTVIEQVPLDHSVNLSVGYRGG